MPPSLLLSFLPSFLGSLLRPQLCAGFTDTSKPRVNPQEPPPHISVNHQPGTVPCPFWASVSLLQAMGSTATAPSGPAS